jgi:membrane protein implicated in regulation of membrane protease activity
MPHIFFGLAIISASLQTAWAMYADGLIFLLPVAAVLVYIGWRYVKSGSQARAKVF